MSFFLKLCRLQETESLSIFLFFFPQIFLSSFFTPLLFYLLFSWSPSSWAQFLSLHFLYFFEQQFPFPFKSKKLFSLSFLHACVTSSCPPCVHPVVHLLSLLSFSFLSHLFSFSFLCVLSMTSFQNMYLELLQFFVCVPFLLGIFWNIDVFLLVCPFFRFFHKKVSIFVIFLWCFWTFSFFDPSLEHLFLSLL